MTLEDLPTPSRFDSRMRRALDELRDAISARYPNTTFHVSRGHDEPENVHLRVSLDLDDPDEIFDFLSDRLDRLQVEDRIPVHVIPVRSLERIRQASLAGREGKHPPRRLGALLDPSALGPRP